MPSFDYAVVGGGIVGLATAYQLIERSPGVRLAVIEKENDWGTHQTGRNSGVIHSGIYYKPGSLKAKLCREGNRRMVEFCQSHGIPHEICGKVIVATGSHELAGIEALFQKGVQNGLAVRRLDAQQVRELEPHVQCLAGLHVPSTGIVDYGAVSRKLAELISSKGGELNLSTRVVGVHNDSTGLVLATTRSDLHTKCLINCAGLHSDRVAQLAGAKTEARIVPFRGEYYELRSDRRFLARNLIYPVPNPDFPFLGVHFTRMIDGSVHAGPNAVLSFKREGYHRTAFNLRDTVDTLFYAGFWKLAARHAREAVNEMYRSFSKEAFLKSLQQLVPEVRKDDLVPSGAGVRAQALGPEGKLVDDFLIIKAPRAVHVCNAPSPAATASLEIGRCIVEQID